MRTQVSLLTAGITLALSGNAGAAALGAAHEIYVGGATAVQNSFREDIVSRFCASNIQVFVDEIENAGASLPGGGDPNAETPILENGEQVVVRCTTLGSFADADLNNKDIAFYKFNGGSATGVAPVDDPVNGVDASSASYMNASPATCNKINSARADNKWTAVGGNLFDLYECPNAPIAVQAPDAGISDVEPKMFVGPLAQDAGPEPAGVASAPTKPFAGISDLDTKPGPGVVFGVAVTIPMYDELQDDQKAAGLLPDCAGALGAGGTNIAVRDPKRDTAECMPSVPTGLVTSVFNGDLTKWSNARVYGLALDPVGAGVTEGDRVNYCRRRSGSGTHAQFSAHYLNTNCAENAFATGTTGPNPPGFLDVAAVYENKGSSDMDDCLDALGDGGGFDGDASSTQDSDIVPVGRTAYAMGYNSLERNTGLTRSYRFVKVDGEAPTLENTWAGDYHDVYYLSYQYRKGGDGLPDLRAGGLRAAAGTLAQKNTAEAFFQVWNSPNSAVIGVVNSGFVVDPDGIASNGDEWAGGSLVPAASSALLGAFNPTFPTTPWSRSTAGGTADSCQELSLAD
jgi:hypothetical protein